MGETGVPSMVEGELPEARYRFIHGHVDARVRELKEQLGGLDFVDVTPPVEDKLPVYLSSDAAVICAGGTMWECLRLGLPTLSYSGTEVQQEIVGALAARETLLDLGYERDFSSDLLGRALRQVLGDEELRQSLHRQGRNLVDGHGVQRIIEAMNYQ